MKLNSYQERKCHDCGKEIRVEDEEIKNGFLLIYEKDNEQIKAYKCKECYEEDKSLRDYQPCECYSRIVGYLRPTSSWNKGKEQEYKERKTFTR